MEFNGLPLHPLIVHVVVVFAPLAALARHPVRRRAALALVAALAAGGDLGDRRRCRDHRGPVRPAAGEPAPAADAAGARRARPPRPDPALGAAGVRRRGRARRLAARRSLGAGLGRRCARRAVPASSRSPCRSCWSPAPSPSWSACSSPATPAPAPSGASTPAPDRASSSRRNDSTRSGSASPRATASSSPHSGSSAPWVQPRGQSSVISSRSGNASIRSSGRTWASPNDRIPGVSMIQPPASARRAGPA